MKSWPSWSAGWAIHPRMSCPRSTDSCARSPSSDSEEYWKHERQPCDYPHSRHRDREACLRCQGHTGSQIGNRLAGNRLGDYGRGRPYQESWPRADRSRNLPDRLRYRFLLRGAGNGNLLPGRGADLRFEGPDAALPRATSHQPVCIFNLSRELAMTATTESKANEGVGTRIVLGQNQYGKAEVRLVKITRDTDRHRIQDLNVTSQLRGDFVAAHLDGDNSHVVATDTQKNTIYALAREGIGSPEALLLRLGKHF